MMKESTSSITPYFLTTPIYYVNGDPHLGHAYTSVAADVIARFLRNDGRKLFFATGTDEHGQKVQKSAEAAGIETKEFVDVNSAKFLRLVNILNCSHNDFIRTTDSRHKDAVSFLWNKLVEKGQIYLGAYEGWYSIRDEAFYSETELIDGKAPTGADVEWVKEESYFFRLSEWTKPLLDFYEENPDFLGPSGRRNEVISFVSQEGGLRDLSVSRTTFTWGVPVPHDPKHVVYVWLDALANYLSVLGYPNEQSENFSRFWPPDLHIVGKDILRFHAVYWLAFLLAAGLPPPKRVFAHGWWTKDGEKMSKSLGNVLDPVALIDKYGVDYVRYYLSAEIPFGNDGDFSIENFISRINSNLANDFGNLAQRALVFVYKNCDGKVPAHGEFTTDDLDILRAATDAFDIARGHVERQEIHKLCECAIHVARLGNKYIDTHAPWTLKKTDVGRMCTVLYVLVEVIRKTAILLEPVMPTACARLLDLLGVEGHLRTFASAADRIPVGTAIREPSPVFPKIDTKPKPSPASTVL